MSLSRLRAALAHRPRDDRPQLLVGELGRKVAADQLALRPPRVGQILAPSVAIGACGLEPALALAAEHRQLVVGALLGRLLQL